MRIESVDEAERKYEDEENEEEEDEEDEEDAKERCNPAGEKATKGSTREGNRSRRRKELKGGLTLWSGDEALSLSFSLLALRSDDFHERYERRGLGKKREIEVEEFLQEDKVSISFLRTDGRTDGLSITAQSRMAY